MDRPIATKMLLSGRKVRKFFLDILAVFISFTYVHFLWISMKTAVMQQILMHCGLGFNTSIVSGSVLQKALLPHITNTSSWSLMQLERCWAMCSRFPPSDERTMSSTRASLSMRISCSATTCRPQLHLEDIRPLQPSSSWPQASTRCSHIFRMSHHCLWNIQ